MTGPLVDEAQIREFHERGMVLGNRLLEPDEAAELREIVVDIVTNEQNPNHDRVHDFKHGGRPLLHVRNMWARYESFRNLYQHPAIVRALSDLTGAQRFNLWHDRFFYKPPQSGGFHSWHQDSAFLPFVRPYQAIGVWIALEDADAENGAMSMVPGSHAWGDAAQFLDQASAQAGDSPTLPERFGENPVEVELCPVPAGYAHIHHGDSWHFSGPNWSERSRCAIAMFFVAADVRFDAGHRWAGDYVGVDGEHLDPEIYPVVDAGLLSTSV